jgi:hypothetical protein
MIECGNKQKWFCSARVVSVLMALMQMTCEGSKFLYFISESKDEDGEPVACLEVTELGSKGRWLSTVHFTGFGYEALLLKAFYRFFLPARGESQLKVWTMLCNGIAQEEDILDGLRIKSLEALSNAIEAARKHGIGLHFFVHPKD